MAPNTRSGVLLGERQGSLRETEGVNVDEDFRTEEWRELKV